MPVIPQVKKSISLGDLHRLAGKINEILYTIELDESISDEQYRKYEKQFDDVYSLIDQLRDQIVFS